MTYYDGFTKKLIDQYTSNLRRRDRCELFEESMMQTLFRDKQFDLIIYCLRAGFQMTKEVVQLISDSGSIKLYGYIHFNKIRRPLYARYEDWFLAVRINTDLKAYIWLAENGVCDILHDRYIATRKREKSFLMAMRNTLSLHETNN